MAFEGLHVEEWLPLFETTLKQELGGVSIVSELMALK
jgi:hypothetical protein